MSFNYLIRTILKCFKLYSKVSKVRTFDSTATILFINLCETNLSAFFPDTHLIMKQQIATIVFYNAKVSF